MARAGSFCSGVVVCILVLALSYGHRPNTAVAAAPPRTRTGSRPHADLITLGRTSNDYAKHFVLTADLDLDPNLPGGKVFDKAVKDIWWILDGKDYPRLGWQLEEK